MPFKSKAQMRWMYATHPEMAKKWSEEQKESLGKKSFKNLPERKGVGMGIAEDAFVDELSKIASNFSLHPIGFCDSGTGYRHDIKRSMRDDHRPRRGGYDANRAERMRRGEGLYAIGQRTRERQRQERLDYVKKAVAEQENKRKAGIAP